MYEGYDKDKSEFITLLKNTNRPGIDELIAHLEEKGFFVDPASARFHSAYEGGLLKHSMNVYKCLKAKMANPLWKKMLENVPNESLVISALLHDVCKAGTYGSELRNKKSYEPEDVEAANFRSRKTDANGTFVWITVQAYTNEDEEPYGHGEKSVDILRDFIELTTDEKYAIRWHMGAYEGEKAWNNLGKAIQLYPLCLALHEADNEASNFLEKDE